MDNKTFSFLEKFLHTNTPSGFEAEGQILWKKRTAEFADNIKVDVHGNVIAQVNPTAKTKVMLAGHCDEIGLMVTYITDEGFFHFASIGGIDTGILPGTQVVFLNDKKTIGVIGKKPIHLLDADDRKKAPTMKDLWIDVGAKNKKEAESLAPVGTPIAIRPNFTKLLNNTITSKAWDNKLGSFVVSEVLNIVKKEQDKLNVSVVGVSTVQEEIGSRGAVTSAYEVDPTVAIAIDVGFATDAPGDDKKVAGDIKLGGGPILHRGANINIPLGKMLADTAIAKNIPVQWSAEPRATATDADALQISRGGTAAALISVPLRYMHTPVEVVSLDDIENTCKLIAETILSMPEEPDFLPY